MVKMIGRLMVVTMAGVLVFGARTGQLPVSTLWWFAVGTMITTAHLILSGPAPGDIGDNRSLNFARALDCSLGALAWILISIHFVAWQYGNNSYTVAAVTTLPALVLLVAAALFVRHGWSKARSERTE